jgi:hypothetical protein
MEMHYPKWVNDLRTPKSVRHEAAGILRFLDQLHGSAYAKMPKWSRRMKIYYKKRLNELKSRKGW